ncbi:MAG: ATP adenylyltransferase [Prochlorococcus sp.]|nr:ATP adenylyltransferase [Prochlorococcus sp.]
MTTENYWYAALQRSEIAQQQGALVPLETQLTSLRAQQGEAFELRRLLGKPPRHLRSTSGPKQNPFLPWDPRLEIASIGNDHALILNKYPVQKGHMLLITRNWAPQEGWLTRSDWEALAAVDKDTQGLWFFNSGPKAGASQPHRHIQLLRRAEHERFCPRQSWFEKRLAYPEETFNCLTQSCAVINRSKDNVEYAGDILMRDYLHLSSKMGLGSPERNDRPLHSYNLLLTPDWIALIRRSREEIAGFSINALGFAGYLLSTQNSDHQWLLENDPESLLEAVVEIVQ